MPKVRKFSIPPRPQPEPLVEPAFDPAFFDFVSRIALQRTAKENQEEKLSPEARAAELDGLIHTARNLTMRGMLGPKLTAGEAGFMVGSAHRLTHNYQESEAYVTDFRSRIGRMWMLDDERQISDLGDKFAEGYRRGFRGKPKAAASESFRLHHGGRVSA